MTNVFNVCGQSPKELVSQVCFSLGEVQRKLGDLDQALLSFGESIRYSSTNEQVCKSVFANEFQFLLSNKKEKRKKKKAKKRKCGGILNFFLLLLFITLIIRLVLH